VLGRSPQPRVEDRHGREQSFRVGVPWPGEQRAGVGDLDDAAEIHDGDAVGDMPHHGRSGTKLPSGSERHSVPNRFMYSASSTSMCSFRGWNTVGSWDKPITA